MALPSNYSARLETGTVIGPMRIDDVRQCVAVQEGTLEEKKGIRGRVEALR